MELDRIIITGAKQHNLKNVTVEIPKKKLVIFTGVSGSGKSSLAFDTLYAEGQRRYIESLNAYARQFLGQMDKPVYDSIRGLAPTISIEQKAASGQSALDRGHGDRDPRLPARALGACRQAHLLQLRPAGLPAVEPADRGGGGGPARGHEVPAPRSPRQGAQGRAPRRDRLRAQGRLHPRARGRDRSLGRGRHPPRQEEEAHDRRGGGPAGGQAGHEAAPDRLRGDRTPLRPGHPGGGPRRPAREGALRASGLPPLRHLLSRAQPPALLLQLAPGHVPGVLGPRHPHGDGPRARDPQSEPHGERGCGEAPGGGGRGHELGHRHRARGGPRARHRPERGLEGPVRGPPQGAALRHGRRAGRDQDQGILGHRRLQDEVRGRHQLDDAAHARDALRGDAASTTRSSSPTGPARPAGAGACAPRPWG